MRVAIIGAGISGLSTAFYLRQHRPDWQITLLDAAPMAGGTMHTEAIDGFLFEAGGNGFLTSKPDSLQLVKDAGAEDLLLPSSDLARKRYIYTDRLHRLPESPPLFLTSGLLTLSQKLRVAAELFVPARRDAGEETLQSFGYRRLGKAFTDVFLDAMTAGIYATTPDRISVNAAFPLVVALERDHGGLFRGMLAKRKKQAGPGGVLMSFKGGVGSFIAHLVNSLAADVQLVTAARDLVRDDHTYHVITDDHEILADRVVLATPAHVAAALLRRLDTDVADLLDGIGYSPIAVVGLGYRQAPRPLDGFGLLTTTAAQLPILGVLWDSSIFPDRAPPGGSTLRVMIGGQRNPELVDQDDAGLLATARAGLARTMDLHTEPDVTYIRRWRHGIPNYAVGHLDTVARIAARIDRLPGLHLNSNAYRGIAMNDCVRNSRLLAESLAAAPDG